MNTTLTGPRSFKATIVPRPRRCTTKSHMYCVCEQPDTLTFDASNAVSKAEQRALFADYTKTAKEQKLVARKESATYGSLPQFTARDFSPSERKFLGKAVGFRPGASHFSPVAGGKADRSANMLHGTVWSLAPYAKAFWVYVEGQGFYAVREGNLLTGVNAA